MRALIALALLPPVPGDVARPFAYAGDPFTPGHHRGVDLAAAPGTQARAACSGRVTFAGRAGPSGTVVTIRCGAWSVTHLPLDAVHASAGARIAQGTRLGTVARSRGHDGLHLGVRRTGDRRGYVDPAPLLRSPPRHAPPAGPRTTRRPTAPPPPHPEPLPSAPRRTVAPGHAPAPPRTLPAQPGSSPPLAPWPAWAGLALLLSGAAGAGGARARRRRRTTLPTASARTGTVSP